MEKTIGILGGMGPLATADLFRKITLLTDAARDNDHIRVYIDSNARIPDRTAAILSGGKDPVPEMASALRSLEACGASCVIMPCNTAHYFLPRLQAMTKLPFISMLEATAKTCAAQYPGRTAAVLATKGTLATGLYEQALAAQAAGADYLGVGAVFSTSTKKDADDVSHETLRRICEAVDIPVVAIGGINEKNILQLKGSGVDGAAIVSAIFGAEDVEVACRKLAALSREMLGR